MSCFPPSSLLSKGRERALLTHLIKLLLPHEPHLDRERERERERETKRDSEACRGEPEMIGGGEVLVILETWMLALYLAALAPWLERSFFHYD